MILDFLLGILDVIASALSIGNGSEKKRTEKKKRKKLGQDKSISKSSSKNHTS